MEKAGQLSLSSFADDKLLSKVKWFAQGVKLSLEPNKYPFIYTTVISSVVVGKYYGFWSQDSWLSAT